jgi:hypothetical protein
MNHRTIPLEQLPEEIVSTEYHHKMAQRVAYRVRRRCCWAIPHGCVQHPAKSAECFHSDPLEVEIDGRFSHSSTQNADEVDRDAGVAEDARDRLRPEHVVELVDGDPVDPRRSRRTIRRRRSKARVGRSSRRCGALEVRVQSNEVARPRRGEGTTTQRLSTHCDDAARPNRGE